MFSASFPLFLAKCRPIPQLAGLLLLLAMAVTACDRPTSSEPPEAPRPTLAVSEFEPDPGEDTYFDGTVTWEFTGGYDGFDVPDADRATSFHLTQVVQLGELRTYISRPASMQILNATVPVDLDSVTLIPSAELRSTERGLGTFTPPDSAEVHNSWIHAAQMGAPPAQTPSASAASAQPPTGRARPRARVGTFVGPAEAAAERARLRASGAREARLGPTLLRFELDRSYGSFAVDFDEVIGAIVDTRTMEGGQLVARTTREYRPVPGGHRLVAETTQLYAPDGTPRERFRATYTNQ